MPRLFGAKVHVLRRQHALTQGDLAQRLGLAAHSHIAKLEAGQDAPSLDLAVRLARVLGVTTDYLLRDAIPLDAPAAPAAPERPAPSLSLFGPRLRALRQHRSMSQTDLARRLGLARRGYISNLETGRKLPSVELVVQLADLFGVTTDDLLCSASAATVEPQVEDER